MLTGKGTPGGLSASKESTKASKESTNDSKSDSKDSKDALKDSTDALKDSTDAVKESTDALKEPTDSLKEPTGSLKDSTNSSTVLPTLCFSTGLDLAEFIAPNKERFEAYWGLVQETWMLLTSFPKVLVAAVVGEARGGGCLLAMTADYRVMVKPQAGSGGEKKGKENSPVIGLDDVSRGLTVPPWLIGHLAYLVGGRRAERMVQLGECLGAQEAAQAGLVDEVCEDVKTCLAQAHEMAQKLAEMPEQGRWMTKDMARRELFRFLSEEEDRKYDVEFFSKFVQHPEVQKNLVASKREAEGKSAEGEK